MSQKTATVQEAQHNLQGLLDQVKSGAEIHLMDGSKTLARLMPSVDQLSPTVAQTIQSLKGLEPLPEGFWCS